MNRSDMIKRAIVFYFSLALFFILLPIVVSYSLGYKIDFSYFRIYKTGIISIKSQPSGSVVYVNGKIRNDLTPTRVEELKPGTYNVEVRRDGFYPWKKDLLVRPNMVTKAEYIVLFPLPEEMQSLGVPDVIDFLVAPDNTVYYMTRSGLFKSDANGDNCKKISSYSNWPGDIKGKKFSPNGKKFLYFSDHKIWIANNENIPKIEEAANTSSPIIDVFWYSDSRHIVFATEKDLSVMETGASYSGSSIMLYEFTVRPRALFYDNGNDSLYFTDLKSAPDANAAGSLYRLDLRQKFFDKFLRRLKKEFEINYENK